MPMSNERRDPMKSIFARDLQNYRNQNADLQNNAAPAAPTVGNSTPTPNVPPAAGNSTPAPNVPPAAGNSTVLKPVDEVNLPEGLGNLFTPPAPTTAPAPSAAPDETARYRSENEELRKQLEELRKQNEEAVAAANKLHDMEEQQQLDNLLSGAGEFSTIAPEDAKKLLQPVIKTLRSENSAVQKKLAEQQAAIDQRFNELNKREHADRQRSAIEKVFKAHPNLEQMQQTKAYQNVMMSPVSPGSALLVGQLVSAELKNGNTDYVIKVLDQVKAQMQTPDLTQVAAVAPGTPAPTVSGGSSTDGLLTDDQLATYRFMVQNREMTRKEFSDIMAKHREALKRRAS